ncbi:MAG: hypothetical protein K2W96_12880 [Gemmataceae bacterium]|nr:hypothetical protein [Gemmataceae bacterium]
MPLIEILCLATGFTGGVTLLWLAGLVRAALTRQPALDARFAGIADHIVQAVAAARREILLLGDAIESPAVLQALLDAKGRKVSVEAVLGPGNEPGAIGAHVAAKPVAANALLIDGRMLLLLSEPFGDGGNLVEARDHAGFLALFRERILATRTPDPAPAPAPEPKPVPVFSPTPPFSYTDPATSAADEVMATMAKPALPPLEEEDAHAGAAPVPLAAELFARLRKEVASAGSDGSA